MDDISRKIIYDADSGDDVEQILRTYDLWDEDNYLPIGGYSNNYTTINVQGRSPEAALGERIINSVDALLLRKCVEVDKLNPRSPNAPKTITEAVVKYYKIPNGRLHEIADSKKKRSNKIRELAEIFLSVTGYDGGFPTISLLDFGEGQTPHQMADTILSLSNKDSPYKQKIRFVQGKFNQGGSGSLKFSDYTFVLTKKAPCFLKPETIKVLNEGKKSGDYGWIERKPHDENWSWTVIRRFHRKDDYDVYKYLAPNKEIISFKEDKLKIAPQRTIPYGAKAITATPYDVVVESGTLIKMFNYKLPEIYNQSAWYSLRRLMDSRVFYRIPLPARIYELRKHKIEGRGDASNLCGLLYTLQDNKQVLYKPGESPIQFEKDIDGVGPTYMECWILDWKNKAAKSEHYFGKMSIAYLVNGQVHHSFRPIELTGKDIKKHNLVGYFFAAVDLTQIPVSVRQNILPPDRQSVDDSPEHDKLKAQIFEWIRENSEFEDIDGKIYESKMGDYSKSDLKISDELFAQMARTHPRLIELLKGHKVSVPTMGVAIGKTRKKKHFGKKTPTHYDFVEK